jgi:hypothetical protein
LYRKSRADERPGRSRAAPAQPSPPSLAAGVPRVDLSLAPAHVSFGAREIRIVFFTAAAVFFPGWFRSDDRFASGAHRVK